MPVSKKRSCRDMSDSDDDDSDDDFLTSVFGTSRSSKRRIAKDEETKKKMRMDQMTSLLDNGKVKLERENRMDKLCQQNGDLHRDESLDGKNNDKSVDEDKSSTDSLLREKSVKGCGSSSLQRPHEDKEVNYFQQYQPKDAKETSCLGSRSTLQFSRVISVQKKGETLKPNMNDKESCGFTPFWFGLQEALTDFRTILLANRQKEKIPSSFTTLREELLQLCSSKAPHACRTYLRKMIMSKKEDQERVRRIPVNVLRWLMALACGPVINGYTSGNGSNNQNSTENTQKKKNRKQATRRPQNLTGNNNFCTKTTDLIASQKLLRDAQMGAYQTLHRLWSQDSGFPLQQHQRCEIYMLSISALSRQLRQWFGSSFSFETASGNNGKNGNEEERHGSIPISSISSARNESNNDTLRVTSSHITLVRFLQLWALALQKQNNNDDIEDNVHLVQFHCKENRAVFRNDVSDAIMSVLWAGLNPSFASSISAKNDGNRSIQTIVACLLDGVRREDTYYKCSNGDVDNVESFEQWLQALSERICITWSKQLGRGRKGTDAYDDEQAWLCLARSVTRLMGLDGGDFHKVGGSYAGLKGHGCRENITLSSLKDFQLSLCRCILKRAFDADQDEQKVQNVEKSLEEKIVNIDGNSIDWISHLIDEELLMMKVPFKIFSSQRWQAMALTVVGLTKLASSFPEEEASKCFALMDICTVCFQSAIVELEYEIQNNCLDENKDGYDDNKDSLITNTDGVNITSSAFKDKILEKHALYNVLVRLENVSEIISNRTRSLIMQNVCFPWASHMAESLRNYVRSQREQYSPPSVVNRVASVKQQSSIITFFKNDPSSKLVTN